MMAFVTNVVLDAFAALVMLVVVLLAFEFGHAVAEGGHLRANGALERHP